FFKRRSEERACQMSAMMFHKVNASAFREALDMEAFRESGNLNGIFGAREDTSPVAGAGQGPGKFTPNMGARISRNSHVLESTGVAILQAESRGCGRESGPVFDAIKALLLDGGDELAGA